MKKNGFTLMELLAVVAIIAVLAIIIVPNVLDSYNNSLIKKMIIDEKSVLDAADIYLEEHCISPLYYGETQYRCPSTYDNQSKTGYICLNELQSPANGNVVGESYIGSIKFKNTPCTGYVVFSVSGNNTIKKTFLNCGSDYQTEGYESDNGC